MISCRAANLRFPDVEILRLHNPDLSWNRLCERVSIRIFPRGKTELYNRKPFREETQTLSSIAIPERFIYNRQIAAA